MNIEQIIGLVRELEVDLINRRVGDSPLKYIGVVTPEFLENCRSVGIKLVGVRKTHKNLPSSKYWGDGFNGVFAEEKLNPWPAIWKAVELSDMCGGAGNPGQCQLGKEKSKYLIDGVYKLVRGRWVKLS